jgi:hypothetical protein
MSPYDLAEQAADAVSLHSNAKLFACDEAVAEFGYAFVFKDP